MAVNLGAPAFQINAPGISVFTPQEWTPSPAYRDTVPVIPRRRLGVVIHYPGVISGDYPQIHNCVEAARSQQASYRRTRGYDLGYNYMVDQGGNVAVVRGRYRSAANGTTDGNENYLAIQILVDPDEGLNAFQVLSVQRIVFWLRTAHDYGLALIGHRNVKATSCPGDQIYAWLKAGGFEPKPEEWPENVFNPWAGRYGPLPDTVKPTLVGGEQDNYVVAYLQGVLINEMGQVITDPEGTYGWSTVSAVINMKTWYNAVRPPNLPPMDPGSGEIALYEWNYLDFTVKT
jgi:hypothetical protein